MQRWRAQVRFRQDPAVAAPGAPRIGKNPHNGFPAQLLLDWVDATRYIKNLRQHNEAATAWARVLLKLPRDQTVKELLPKEERVGCEVLRRARVKVDVCAMLLWRQLWSQATRPTVYAWTDASPQWKGTEYCATSIEVVDNGVSTVRLLPCVSMSRGQTSAVFKCLTMLHQLFLMVGARELQSFCSTIRGVVTDMGTERLIAKMSIDTSSSFFKHIGVTTYVGQGEGLLFPGALQLPGWKHAMDLITRRGLWLLPFFLHSSRASRAL